jgi:hypothetical protein
MQGGLSMLPTEHAYFSERHAELRGTVIYLTLSGEEIEVTAIGPPDWIKKNYDWPDRKHVGVVRELVRYGRAPTYPFFKGCSDGL